MTGFTESPPPFLNGGGEMGSFTRRHDWSKTSLGMPDTWPQSLRTVLSLLLNSRFPMFLFWGPEHICFYNDAYRPSLGNEGKHPFILGMPGKDAWPDIWDFIGPMIDNVLGGEGATWYEDQFLPIYRNGRMEDVYWTFSYSPISDESGEIAGVFVTCTETTKSVASLAALNESEQRFQNLLRDATVGLVVLTGEDMHVEMVNEPYCRLIGHSVAQTLHRPLFNLIPDAEATFLPILQHVRATGIPFSLTNTPYKVHGADGAVIEGFINVVYQPYREADGAISGVMAVVHDVTDQTRVQQQAEVANQSLQLAIDIGDLGDFRVELPGKIATYSSKVAQWFGLTEQATPLADVFSRVHAEDRAKVDEVIRRSLSGEADGRHDLTYRVPWPGGGSRVLRSVGKVQVRDGLQTAIVGIIQDVTEQAEYSQSLKAGEEKLKAAIELAELATWNIDLQAKQITYSPRLQEWLGVLERTLSVEASPLVHERDRERILAALQATLSPDGNGLFDEVYTITHTETGQHKIIHSSGKAEFDPDGNAISISGISQDVTMQQQLQLALENEVQQRTEELAAAVDKLSTANAQLQHSNDELAQYAYVASHDLQEPLRKIRVFTGMLKTGHNIPGGTRQTIDKIIQSAERMSGLIHDLLEFSRLLKSDKLMRPVALKEVVATVWGDFELIAEEKSATIEVGELPTIQGVNLQFNQLFYNLISNALKFTIPEKRPHIAVTSSLISQEEAGNFISRPLPFSRYYHIAVSDNGIGFETQYNELIFDVFKQLHTRDMYSGSGIGLALCRRVVTNHHGVLYAQSEIGKGSTFHIILPERQHETTSDFSADYSAFPAAN